MQPEQQEPHGLQILAVDDEESNLLLLRRILEPAAYTNVETTTDPSRRARDVRRHNQAGD